MSVTMVEFIELEKIKPHPGNRRVGGFDKAGLQSLADSIKAVGVQQPAIVTRDDPGADDAYFNNGSFTLVAGERRWRACKLAGELQLPCIIRELTEAQIIKIQTIENLQREDVHPLDEANGYKRLITKLGYDAKLLAGELGRSEAYIYQRLQLLKLVKPARELLAKNRISAGHAHLVARLPEQQQKAVSKEIVEHLENESWGELTVKTLDDHIKRHVIMELHGASFRKNDADLYPQAGACESCPKRSGAAPMLFPDFAKAEKCLDPECYTVKLDNLVQRRLSELTGAGEPFMKVAKNWTNEKGVLNSHEYQECKQKAKGAKRALVVEGSDRGKLLWAKKPERQSYTDEKTPEEKAAEKKNKLEAKIKKATRERTWSELMDHVGAEMELHPGQFPEDMFRLCVQQVAGALWFEYKRHLVKAEGWEIKEVAKGLLEKIGAMPYNELMIMLYKISLINQIEGPGYDYESGDREDLLEQQAGEWDVDVAEIRKAVTEELTPKKKGAKKK